MNGMTCREFDEVVHGFVHMELLDVSLREAAIEHATHCDRCAERLGAARMLAEITETAAGSLRGQQTPPSVEAALLSAFRNKTRRRRVTLWRGLEWAAAVTAAAMLGGIFWTSSNHSKVQSTPTPRKDLSSRSNEPLDASGLGSSAAAEVDQATELEASNGDAEGAYSMSDFVPVPFTDGIEPEDPGMIVRVQLTRASLAELGYPVADAPDEDLIRADVWVDQDGWPRGVRLVQ
jgi:hypothetical protein